MLLTVALISRLIEQGTRAPEALEALFPTAVGRVTVKTNYRPQQRRQATDADQSPGKHKQQRQEGDHALPEASRRERVWAGRLGDCHRSIVLGFALW